MNRITNILITLLLITTMPVMAQSELISTIKTHRYETYGEENIVTFWLGSTEETEILVDFGNGPKAYTLTNDFTIGEGEEDSEEESVLVGGIEISGSVTEEGIIRIYGDASKIDYVNVHGSEVYEIDLSKLWNLSILELSHNDIHTLTVGNLQYMEYVRLNDNPFDEGLYLGVMPMLKYLNVNQMGDHALDHCDGVIDLTIYRALYFFTAWDSHCLKHIDTSKCTNLTQLSIDNTSVETLDVTKNAYLQILNISDTPMNTIDLSKNTYLVEFYCANEGRPSGQQKFSSIDFSNNTYLQRIFLDGNNLTTLDVSKQWNLVSLYAANNKLTSIKGVDINEPADQRPVELAYLDISGNCFTYATLPEVDPMTYYYYVNQKPAPVAKEQCAGQPIDLSHIAVREGSTTLAGVLLYSRDETTDPVALYENQDYIIETDDELGTFTLTILNEQADSAYIAFANDLFPDVKLITTSFLVRSEAEYGKPVKLFSYAPSTPGNTTLTFITREDEDLILDLGDGSEKTVHTIANTPTSAIFTSNSVVTVKGRVATSLKGLFADNVPMSSIDLSLLVDLADLRLTNCGLTSIDLAWNRSLKNLDLSGNELTELDITGASNAFHKNLLSDIKATGNSIKTFTSGLAQLAVHNINLSNNALEGFVTEDFENLVTLNLSNNALTELTFSDCESLETLNVSHNNLKALDLSTCKAIQNVDATFNSMRYSTMPEAHEGYMLAPQSVITISKRAGTCDLASEAVIGGTVTTYTWREDATGALLTEGIDYTLSNGITKFLSPAEGHTVHCELSNALFPDFVGENILSTSSITVMGQPAYEVASFTTPVGDQSIQLSLASTVDDTYIYIDWGNGEYVEYPLQTSYTVFEGGQTIEDAQVKVYSNDASHGNIRVFSVSNVKMSSIDVSKMTELYCLTLSGAGLETIDISNNLNLGEVNFDYNNLSQVDFTKHTALNWVNVSHNNLTEVPLPENNHIGLFAAAYNNIESIDTKTIESASTVDLANNQLTEFDLTKIPYLNQLFISQNKLTHLDTSGANYLAVLDISTNNFDLSTLPLPTFNSYFYGNQANIKIECVGGKIDLSSQAVIDGTPTDIYFFDAPVEILYDEDDNAYFTAGEFIEGTDFTNDNGIITFYESQPVVVAALMNELFPSIVLYSDPISVVGTAIEDVIVDNIQSADGRCYNLAGQRVNASAKGLIIKNGKKVLNK